MSVGIQELVRRVPLVRQTRMSVGRRVMIVVVMLMDMGPPSCRLGACRVEATEKACGGTGFASQDAVGHCASGEGEAFRE